MQLVFDDALCSEEVAKLKQQRWGGIWEGLHEKRKTPGVPASLLFKGRKYKTFSFLALSICLSTQVIIPSLSPWLQSTFGNYIQPLCGASRKMSLREKKDL